MSKLKRYINKNVKPWKPCHEAHKAVVTESYECCRLLPTIPRSVTLHGLPLHGWVAVIPRGFLFAVIPLRVDCVLWRWSRREELCEPVTMTNSKIKWCDLILFSMQCMHTVKYTLVNHSIISTPVWYIVGHPHAANYLWLGHYTSGNVLWCLALRHCQWILWSSRDR